MEEFNGCSDYELTCVGTEHMFEDGVIEEAGSDGSGASRAAAMLSSLGGAVAGLAGVVAGALLLLP